MTIKYFYIDDDPVSTIVETAKGLSMSPKRLKVIAHQHKGWQDQIEFIIKNQSEFDGLILDWSLINKNEEKVEANFGAEALAQQLRRLIVEKKKIKNDFPIVLCSAQSKFKKIFSKELTGHDLFDEVFEKNDFDKYQSDVVLKLIDLAKGYKALVKKLKPNEILNIKDISKIDYRLIEKLEIQRKEGLPIHEKVRFLLKSLIEKNGILISENLLATRIGALQRDDWNDFLKKVKKHKYTGVFSEASDRWWMNGINEWWNKNFKLSLGSLSGPERIDLINEKFDFKLTPLKKTPKSKSDNFWVVCKESDRSISIDDAILSRKSFDKHEWIENEYYSIDSALELSDSSLIHPLERDRMKRLKKIHAKKRKK